MITVWGRRSSINVQKVLWGLMELGIPFARRDAGGKYGFPIEFESVVPFRQVPILEDQGVLLWESNTILRYLAEKHSAEKLYPAVATERAAVESWMDWQLGLRQPLRVLYLASLSDGSEEARAEGYRHAVDVLNDCFTALNRYLEKRDFLVADRLTLCDISIGPFVYRWSNVTPVAPELPALNNWMRRLSKRPGFHRFVSTARAFQGAKQE